MQMRVMDERLSPCVQDGEEADGGPEVFRIGGDGTQLTTSIGAGTPFYARGGPTQDHGAALFHFSGLLPEPRRLREHRSAELDALPDFLHGVGIRGDAIFEFDRRRERPLVPLHRQ